MYFQYSRNSITISINNPTKRGDEEFSEILRIYKQLWYSTDYYLSFNSCSDIFRCPLFMDFSLSTILVSMDEEFSEHWKYINNCDIRRLIRLIRVQKIVAKFHFSSSTVLVSTEEEFPEYYEEMSSIFNIQLVIVESLDLNNCKLETFYIFKTWSITQFVPIRLRFVP